jgi:signal peptidase I
MAENNARIPPHYVMSAPPNEPAGRTAVTEPAVPKDKARKGPAEAKDSPREIVETVVFVVVLVLLLKSFVAEAFVIPTGSMAETLWGYQKVVQCPECHYSFPVNCSSEVEPPRGSEPIRVVGCICPNCRYPIDFANENERARVQKTGWKEPAPSTGDRVLVAKFLYDFPQRRPERQDVVVFKYPEGPQENFIPKNYIKRLVGLPGETVGIYYGDLYYVEGVDYEGQPLPDKREDLWKREYMYEDAKPAQDFWKNGKFQIIRKPPAIMLAERRIVYDNDHQNRAYPRRWEAESSAWQPDNTDEPRRFQHPDRPGGGTDWLRYRHVLEPGGKPELITDFMGYNTYASRGMHRSLPGLNWVGDLMLECEAVIEQAQGQLVLELAEGVDRFQARFDLAAGSCSLWRLANGREDELARKQVTLKPGKYQLRFANFDERLTVWVNGALPFDQGVNYLPAVQRGPTANDLQPAGIGVQGGTVSVAGLRLWRDTYYTVHTGGNDAGRTVDWANPLNWDGKDDRGDSIGTSLRELPFKTLYVQPGHYLCLGDNSPESSDGRAWGLVPERLLLGRALAIYYPFYFPYWPLYSPVNRIGSIK